MIFSVILWSLILQWSFGTNQCLDSETAPSALGPFFQDDVPSEYSGWCTKNSVDAIPLKVNGTIVDHDLCLPIMDVKIHIWQANPEGEYDNNHDLSTDNCRTIVYTNEEGFFELWTYLPGLYKLIKNFVCIFYIAPYILI